MKTTIDLALIRWSVTCTAWSELAAGHVAHCGAFLAGWFCCDAGIPIEAANGIEFINSWRKGWRECESQLAIMAQAERTTPPHET